LRGGTNFGIEGRTVRFCTIVRAPDDRVQKRTVWVPNCITAAERGRMMQKRTVPRLPTQRS
jgi:hypothetical protein